MASTDANVSNNDLWSPRCDIFLTEGQHRTLCVSNQLPECLRPPGNDWSVDQFDLLTELYHGKISLLHKAVHKATGMPVAIKQYKKKYLTALAKYQIEREVRIHISLQHPHIIKLMAVFEDPDQVYLVQEFAPGGDLFEALKRQPSMMYDEQEAVGRFMEPCLQALAYMQERRIIHRDIKPENILLGEGGAVKLADFGLAINQEQERPVTRAGTLDYMAPEVLVCPDKKRPEDNKDKASLGYDEQVDAWAIGCLAAELVTGSPPFESESRSATYQLIMYREPKLPARLSKAAKNFATASLNKNAKDRASVEQLLQHEWITSNAQAFRQQIAASKQAAPVTQQRVAVSGEAATPAPTEITTQGQPGNDNNSSSTLASQQPAADVMACSRSGSSARTLGSKAASLPAAAAAGPCTAPSIDAMISAAAGILEGLQQTPVASSCVAADATAAETTTASDCVPRAHVDSSTVLPTDAADLQAVQASEQATWLAANPEAQQPCAKGLAPLPAGTRAATLADDVSAAAVDTVVYTASAAKPLLPAVEAAPVITQAALPAAVAAAAAATPDSAAEASKAEGGDTSADGASSSSGSSIKARLARASSHHGHRLHKLFYPHDRHRRSSYNNCNTQWDDFIDTSAHSFTSNSAAMLLANSIVGAAVDSAAAGVSCMVAASRGTSFCYGAAGLQQGLCSTGSSFVSVSPESHGIAAGKLAGSCSASSSTNSSNTARRSVLHQAGLAALPDAGLQAPASVVEQVLSTAASGALHLLAANDLEDLIAVNPAPGSVLTSLGLVETSGQQPCSADTYDNSCRSTQSSCSGAAAIRASTRSKDGTAPYPGAIMNTLNDCNLDDFIATSASPGGSKVNRVSVLVSRSASAANLSALAASAPQSPLPSPKSMSAAVTAGISNCPMMAANSPRNNRVKSAAATAFCRAPDAPAGSYCALQPRPPKIDRSSPALKSLKALHMGGGSWSAAPTACGAVSSVAPSAKPLVRPKSAMCGTLVIPNVDTLAADACIQGESLQHASCSLPAGCQLGQSATPTGGSRKSVVWADSAAAAAAAAAPCVDSTPRASMSPRSAAAAAAAGSGMQRSASCAAIREPSTSSCHSPRLQPAWQSGFEQQDGSSSSSSRKQSSMQPSLPQPQQQQQGEGPPLPGANYYCPPTGVLSSDVGLACPAKGQLGSKAMLAPLAGHTPHRSTSSFPAGLQAAAAADTLEPVQGASSMTAAGGTNGTAAGGTRTSRAAELCSGSLAGDAAAALGEGSGVFDAAVPFAAVHGMSATDSTSLIQPGRVSSNQDEFTQSSSEQHRSVRRSSSTDGNAAVSRVNKAYRRCRGSSSGSDDCDMNTLRQPAKSFTAGFGAALLAGAGATAARSSSRQGVRCRRSLSNAECELADTLAARQQRQSFPGKGLAAVVPDGVCGTGTTACTHSRRALTPTKLGACVPGGKGGLQKLRSKSVAESGISAWPH